MALLTLTGTAPVLVNDKGRCVAGQIVVTANAAEARAYHLGYEAARMRRVAAGLEKAEESDNLFHTTADDQAKRYEAMAEVWMARALEAPVAGVAQVVAEGTDTGVKRTTGYHRINGKGRL